MNGSIRQWSGSERQDEIGKAGDDRGRSRCGQAFELAWLVRVADAVGSGEGCGLHVGGGIADKDARARALATAGLAHVHFHDLRHTGNTLAASAGTTLRELMDRMGHDSQRAAMIYLHGSDAREHEIADSLSKLAREELRRGSKRTPGGKRSGTQRARSRKQAS